MKIFFLFFIFTSCSSIDFSTFSSEKPEEVLLTDYSEFGDMDYVDHLKSFESIYKARNKRNLVKLKYSSQKYLDSITSNITINNELFFKQGVKATYYVVKSKIPFHFSLPGRKFFFSSSLIKKYIKNEAMLYCLLVYELVRSEKNIYNRTIIIPTKTLNTNRVLSLLRLKTVDKVEIHKWAYYLLKRVGIETDSYLSWLQIKNRNSLDFTMQLGDIQTISREEAMFKAFLIETDKKNSNKYRGSSKKFYTFLNDIKR
jgi:hypothetical protein